MCLRLGHYELFAAFKYMASDADMWFSRYSLYHPLKLLLLRFLTAIVVSTMGSSTRLNILTRDGNEVTYNPTLWLSS